MSAPGGLVRAAVSSPTLELTMKTYISLLIALAVPLAVVAQDQTKPAPAAAPAQQVISSYRIMPKVGHDKALETALASHAKKFHKGENVWRVGVIMSGPDEGMYHIVEGPTNWAGVDSRGDLGEEHTKDYLDNIAPHVEKSTPNTYLTYVTDLSSTGPTQWTNKVMIDRLVVKPGRGADLYDALKKWKAINDKLGLAVAVWHAAFSGENSYAISYRLKDGFKVFDEDKPKFRKAADELFGPNEYARLLQADTDDLVTEWQELVEFKPELGSK